MIALCNHGCCTKDDKEFRYKFKAISASRYCYLRYLITVVLHACLMAYR